MSKSRIVIASDSFKGTLSSLDICHLFMQELKDNKDVIVTYLPIGDGGEGSLEAIVNAIDGHFIDIEVTGLYFQKVKTRFYIDINNNAYIETASCCGLINAKSDNDPGKVTTLGLGEQIVKAKELGCKNIYIFLGGSASNDGGVGLACALGTKFYDKNDKEFIPTGLTLKNIVRIKKSQPLDVNITILSDVKSPFYGLEGAAYKFAAQKGASKEEIKLLDEGLVELSNIINKDLNKDISNIPGAGAAGGLGGGLLAFSNAEIRSGIDAILDLISFDEKIKDSDIVISGEGKLDKQTYDGKVIDGIAKRCEKYHKPLIIVVGVSEISLEELKKIYPCVLDLYETNEKHLPFEEIKKTAKEDYLKIIYKIIS